VRLSALFVIGYTAVVAAQALTVDARAKAEQIWNRYVALEAASYKVLVRTVIPLARARFSTLKNDTSPISVLVGPGPSRAWLIFEEFSESRP